MFGLFSRKTSAPVTATVTTTGSLFQALIPRHPSSGARQRRALLVGDRSRAPLRRDPRAPGRTPPRPRTSPGVVEDALAGGHARAAELADRALHGHRLEGRVDLAAEAHRAAPDDVLLAADAVLLQERVPSLLEVGEHDRVVDVAEPVEVAPAHLHAVPGVGHAPPRQGPAPRAAAASGAPGRARRRRGRACSRCRRACGRSTPIPSAASAAAREARRHREEQHRALVGGQQDRRRLAARRR